MNFGEAIVNGIPLVLVIIGMVEWLKQLGVAGKALVVASMLVGMLLGGLYQMSVAMPVSFGEWFGVAVYGLALGLVASGLYDAVQSATKKRI